MSKVPRSYDELKAAVEHQLIFLKDYCQKYDDGNIQYASQIASRIRVLLSDSKNSKSAITLLQDATGVNISLYRDHRNYPKPHFDNEGKVKLFSSMMCAYEVSSDIGVEPTVVPKLRCNATLFPRLPWWEDCTVAHWNGIILTRKKIILMLADEDGGAHIDVNISEELISLKRKCIQSPKLYFNFVDGTKKSYVVDTEKALYAIVRTIGEEVIETISPYLERI